MLRLAEASTLFDALEDPLFRPALEGFFGEQKRGVLEHLLTAVRRSNRDTMAEARLAGKAEVYDEIMGDLLRFAEKNVRESTQ
ncbi:MAG TPA: hypothetical protein VN517_16185 [Terriglobales bacterium]|nr:hypothetical protein [Terriglobales bacterium]